jgi:hypothetical protein
MGGFAVTLDGADVVMTWSLATPAPQVKIVRKLGSAPTSELDGELAYAGPSSPARHPTSALLPSTASTARPYTWALFACDATGQGCAATGLTDTRELTVMQALRGGGYVFYFRHAETVDPGTMTDVCSDNLSLGYASTTSSPDWWRACTPDVQVTPSWSCSGANVRQLSSTGVSQSQAVGQHLRARQVPFSRVLASEMCRGFRTAELMNLGPVIEQRPELTYYVYGNVQNRCNELQAHLASVPAAGTNVALVSHSAIGGDSGGAPTLDPALCLTLDGTGRANAQVFKPLGDGGTMLVLGQVTPATWLTLP